MSAIPFQTINWDAVEKTEHPGSIGMAYWQTVQLGGLRIRLVEYSEKYLADHWCRKGHIVHCLEGELISEMENGGHVLLSKGMTYVVSDNLSSHRSVSKGGARLLIVDGDFLKNNNDEYNK
ncbi:MAG: DHCW motif cupin fold protein [Sediminibacterium sp.]|nr:DHCW motif cupin fold protein [Sediminibacterium sp.]